MKTLKLIPKPLFWILLLTVCQSINAQPYFQSGQDPRPISKAWEKKEQLSDEFGGSTLDLNKWKNTDAARWIGRAPGLFKANTVSVGNGDMRITNYKLSSPEVVSGSTFTHACGHVISQEKATVGDYIECRMKANKTFMSSTFWLINYRNEGTGCDQRVTELDIQECVGHINSSASWTQSFNQSMHSNTHSRNVQCSTPVGSKGNDVAMSGKVYEDYHVYGAWWKSPTEILFFLDGKYQYTVTPIAQFNLDMYIKLVTETYDWNPVPADGGMTGSWDDRTTKYDWVRTWKLIDTPQVVESVQFNNVPTQIPSQSSYTLNVDYVAGQSRDIVVQFWNETSWMAGATKTVGAGAGSTTITISLANAPADGTGYKWKLDIRPIGSTWVESIDTDQINNITVLTLTDNITNNAPSAVFSQTSYTIDIDYTAASDRDIVVEFWSSANWLGSTTKTVSAGTGSTPITINLPTAPSPGTGYTFKSSIRPVGGNWTTSFQNSNVTNVTVTSQQLIANGEYEIRNIANEKNLAATYAEGWKAVDVNPGNWLDQRWWVTHLGNDIYELKLAANWDGTKYLEVPYAACANGTLASTYSQATDTHQKWKIEKAGNQYMIKPTHCLDQALDVRPSDQYIHTWSANSINNNQLWRFIPSTLGSSSKSTELPGSNNDANGITLYPNPATNGEVTLSIDNDEPVDIYISDINGNMILSRRNVKHKLHISVSDLMGSGVYVVRIQNNDYTKISKLVIH